MFKKFEYLEKISNFERDIFQDEKNIQTIENIQTVEAFIVPIEVSVKLIKSVELIKSVKKQQIPKHIKTIIWNTYIGDDIIKHKCLCCKRVTIKITEFDAGHIISEKVGGTHEINNLRPICSACNHSMGSMNMIEYIKKYGLYI